MIQYNMSDKSDGRPPRVPPRRRRRLARRVVFPLALLCLVIALTLNGFVRLAGPSAGRDHPYQWAGDTIFIAGGFQDDVYTTCAIVPESGPRRHIDIPGDEAGARVSAWFPGSADVTCGHTVSITSGPQSILYPLAANRVVILALAAIAAAAWWLGRRRLAP